MPKNVKSILISVSIFAVAVIAIFAWRSLPDVPFTASPTGNGSQDKAEAQEDPEKQRLAASEVGANELGLVPILIYHYIGEKEGRWTRTPENFRQDLQELYNRDYVLVPLNDYLSGNIDIPAGKSPVVITFDDSTVGHFRLLEKADGETAVDPDCAVGILRSFAEEHPGFGHVATFFVNAEPFGQTQYWKKKLQLLNEWGFEIGNHTFGHKNLQGLSAEKVAEQIVSLQQHIQEALPDYTPQSFAIVQDGIPESYDSLFNGQFNGVTYKHNGVLMWAWSAARSPLHKEFDPGHIQRIQVFQDNGQSSLVNWLERISAKRYISDGNNKTVAIPEGWQEVLKENHGKNLVVYQPEQTQRTPEKEKQAQQARGVHVTFSYASSLDRWSKILQLTEHAQLNTVQLDIKDESGRIGYLSEVKMAQEIGSGRDMMPIREMLDQLRDLGIYSVGRIVIFRDPFLAQKKPEYMVRDKNGNPLGGGVWVDTYNKEVWDYNIALAEEAYNLGFDEVQFDYIRFPEGLAARTAIYGAADSRDKVDVVADFLSSARNKLGWNRILSATVFGFTGYASDDLGIGQRPEHMAPFIDYLSPMVYPSHYSRGNYGFDNPNAHPYEVVDGSLKDFQELIESTGCGMRPWLQSFTMGYPAYGRNQIRAQIDATEDNGFKTWLLWNPGVYYKVENIVP